MSTQLALADASAPRYWRQVDKFDRRAVDLADRHYSRQTIGSYQFMPPGRTLVLLAEMWTRASDCRAVWGVVENLDPVGNLRFRCSIFRNETPWLSSDLVREATTLTIERWRRRFGWLGAPPCPQKSTPARYVASATPGAASARPAGRSSASRAGWSCWRRRVIDVTASGHYIGDCRALLREMPDACVQTCVTSPPYWGLRDYGVDGQIGLEATPEEYIEQLVAVFADVLRVLRDDGTLWLNLGDCYAHDNRGGHSGISTALKGRRNAGATHRAADARGGKPRGYKPKDMIGQPWMAAFALRAAGWYLRCDIIWHKANPMPEAVTDRPTKSHEYLFLFSKNERYYYDAAAVREPITGGAKPRGFGVNPKAEANEPGSKQNASYSAAISGYKSGNRRRSNRADAGGIDDRNARQAFGVPWEDTDGMRNRRSVWTTISQPYSGAHFATFPPALIEPCILAGSKVGDVVLDPFFGSGTTGQVAEKHGRRWIGFDINPAYEQLQKERTAQRSLVLGGEEP